MVNDHYPYEMAISLGIYPIFRQTHLVGGWLWKWWNLWLMVDDYLWLIVRKYLSAWWFFAIPLKNDGVRQWGWWNSQFIWKVIKVMFQTFPKHQPAKGFSPWFHHDSHGFEWFWMILVFQNWKPWDSGIPYCQNPGPDCRCAWFQDDMCFSTKTKKRDGIVKTPSKKLELYENGTRPFSSLGWVFSSVGTELWKNVINCRSQPQKFSGNPPGSRHSCRMLDFKVITTRNFSPSQAHPIFFWWKIPAEFPWIPHDESLNHWIPILLSHYHIPGLIIVGEFLSHLIPMAHIPRDKTISYPDDHPVILLYVI